MAQFAAVNDSGAREEFTTGSRRDTRQGKGRYDLITPIGLRRLAMHYENGAAKYGDRNWERGQPVSRYLDSAIRHLYAHLAGDRSEDHLAAAAWNSLAAIHTEECAANGTLPPELANVLAARPPAAQEHSSTANPAQENPQYARIAGAIRPFRV